MTVARTTGIDGSLELCDLQLMHAFDRARCKKPFNVVCKDKEQMVPCNDHPQMYTLRGKPCATCKADVEADDREEKENEEEKKRIRIEKENARFLDNKKRKKPNVTPGRGSQDQPEPEDTAEPRR